MVLDRLQRPVRSSFSGDPLHHASQQRSGPLLVSSAPSCPPGLLQHLSVQLPPSLRPRPALPREPLKLSALSSSPFSSSQTSISQTSTARLPSAAPATPCGSRSLPSCGHDWP
ncbi:MAG: hypothetical protein Q8P67_11715 [archaeon]|nr:hypothetical protein [archaeon]